ncbi:MAG: hypothetical protein HY898_00460 [Deltaproteobacteria bacterium]|nr:hypothetical protein [Deltaproteobacteria bacterium]
MVGLVLGGCSGSADADPCASTVCSSGTQCVEGKCVLKPLGDAGPHVIDSGTGNDVSTGDDSGMKIDAGPIEDSAPSEPTECFKSDIPYTNTQLSFAVPPGARWMHVKAWGGGANQEGSCPGGVGAYTEASFEVKPGTELVFVVGAPGSASTELEQMLTGFGRTGGSGLTGVFSGPGLVKADEFSKAWMIAAGGGGAGVQSGGGPCIPGVPGNHPTAGGMPTMLGGVGLDDNVNGGGGGYRGGKGGAKGEKGFGGTSYVDPARATDSFTLQGEIGDEMPPNTGDPDYKNNAGSYETPGLLVVKFTCDKPVVEPPK